MHPSESTRTFPIPQARKHWPNPTGTPLPPGPGPRKSGPIMTPRGPHVHGQGRKRGCGWALNPLSLRCLPAAEVLPSTPSLSAASRQRRFSPTRGEIGLHCLASQRRSTGGRGLPPGPPSFRAGFGWGLHQASVGGYTGPRLRATPGLGWGLHRASVGRGGLIWLRWGDCWRSLGRRLTS